MSTNPTINLTPDRLETPYDLPAICLSTLQRKAETEEGITWELCDLRWTKTRREALESRRELRKLKVQLEENEGDVCMLRGLSIMPDKTCRVLYSDRSEEEDRTLNNVEKETIDQFLSNGGDLVLKNIADRLEVRRSENNPPE